MKKNSIGKAILPQTKKSELKAPVKVNQVISPKLAANHNQRLLTL